MTSEQIVIFKAMSPARKLELAAWFHASARRLKTHALRAQHPDWSDERIARRVAELFLYAAN